MDLRQVYPGFIIFGDRELYAVKRLELKFSLSSEFAEFFDEVPVRILHDMLFRMFRFSQVSFNAMTSSFIKFNFGDTETYGRLPWQFCTFTCGIVNKR